MIRAAGAEDFTHIHSVINDGAAAYRGVIPPDCWHEPYMTEEALAREIADGVVFACYVEAGRVVGVMGAQDKGAVMLIRHAYVRTTARRRGIGAALLADLTAQTRKPVLIGTWRAAGWAVDFYLKHGFSVLPDAPARELLERFWQVPALQMDTSVVLADRRFLATAHGGSSAAEEYNPA